MKTSLFAYFIKFRRAIAAGCAGLALLMVISSFTGGTTGEMEVVVATHDIGAGTRVKSGDLTKSTIKTELPWGGLLTAQRQAIGRTTSHTISAGQPFSTSDLVSSHSLRGLRPGTVAMEIGPSQIANASLLEAGHHIDLYSATTDAQPSADLIAHDVVVLTQGSQVDRGVGQSTLSASSSSAALVIAVSPTQATRIAANLTNCPLVAVLLNYQ